MDEQKSNLVALYLPTLSGRDISVRFLSWECWAPFEGDTIISEDPRRSPKSSEDVRSLRTSINASSLSVLFNSKIRDREEGIVISSFYTRFSFLTWVQINIFLKIVSSKTATSHILISGVRNWPARRNTSVIKMNEKNCKTPRQLTPN